MLSTRKKTIYFLAEKPVKIQWRISAFTSLLFTPFLPFLEKAVSLISCLHVSPEKKKLLYSSKL
jgi:hypothetical protein